MEHEKHNTTLKRLSKKHGQTTSPHFLGLRGWLSMRRMQKGGIEHESTYTI